MEVKGWSNGLHFNWAADGKGIFVVCGKRGTRVVVHVDLLRGERTRCGKAWEQLAKRLTYHRRTVDTWGCKPGLLMGICGCWKNF